MDLAARMALTFAVMLAFMIGWETAHLVVQALGTDGEGDDPT